MGFGLEHCRCKVIGFCHIAAFGMWIRVECLVPCRVTKMLRGWIGTLSLQGCWFLVHLLPPYYIGITGTFPVQVGHSILATMQLREGENVF